MNFYQLSDFNAGPGLLDKKWLKPFADVDVENDAIHQQDDEKNNLNENNNGMLK